ncbi:MAG: LytR C-terminal domain-containing protein [Actinomycetales bacterium]|nr:LytR C-terminal domain-containing protein [Actinomycetales bacterium]
MPKASAEFPEDEFDVVGSTRPRSPHRAPKSLARRIVPFVVAIILGPLLAYVIVTAISTGSLPGQGGDEPTTQTTGDTVTPSVEPDDEDETETETTDEEPSPEESESETTDEETTQDEPDADPDQSTRVMVLNSTSTAGLAGRGREALEAAGWTNVATGNFSGTLPGSTVFYGEDDPVLEASARAVAEELGIETVELDAEQASDPITVVLEADFEP